MGGSAAEAPTMPDAQPVRGLRASDAERDEVVAKLTEEFAAGRLSHDTFLFRMHAVLEALHQSDLPRVLADLPGAPGSASGPDTPGSASAKSAGAWPVDSPPWPGGSPPPAPTRAGASGLAGWLLSDISSTNGTRVNGWLVRGQVPVRAGDLVSFGNAEYWLSAAEEV